jgi:hypothetical protein
MLSDGQGLPILFLGLVQLALFVINVSKVMNALPLSLWVIDVTYTALF